jgi:hypothetical protein
MTETPGDLASSDRVLSKINYLFDEKKQEGGCLNVESAIEALAYENPHASLPYGCYGPNGFSHYSFTWLFIIKLESKCDTRKSRCSKKGCPRRIFRKVKWELMDAVLGWYNHSGPEEYREWWKEEERKEGLEELEEFEIEQRRRIGER